MSASDAGKLEGAVASLPSAGDSYSARTECDVVIHSIARKANKNKRNARFSAATLTGLTAAVPVSLIVAEQFGSETLGSFAFGRLVPGLLAFGAAVLARWIQIEQPHQRWTLYRHWQRRFEAERLRYRQGIDPYSDESRDDVLAEKLAQGQLVLDGEWATLVPTSATIAGERGDPV